MIGFSSRAAFLAGCAATVAIAPARAAQARTLRVTYFPGADMLPVWIANANGFFVQQNLDVVLTPTTGSVAQFQHLSASDFDVALTALDNAIAYDEGQGEAPLPNPADFVAILGGDSAFLRLYARPEITSYDDLRGKTLTVDAVTTGFAFVLRSMLASRGLQDGDYTLVAVGGTPSRYNALLAGRGSATLLNAPFDLFARAKGMTMLDDVVRAIGPYQGVVSVVRKGWLNDNLEIATAYVRAVTAGLTWMYDPANRAACVQLLIDTGKLPAPIAAQMYPVLTDPASGMSRSGALDIAGVRTVLALRSRYGRPQRSLTNPLAYYDDRAFARSART